MEAFLDMKQKSWINAHVHMYEYFGGVARILVPDNCKTAVIHNGGFKDQQINETYQEMAEYYGTAIIPARVRAPKDKPNAEGTVGNISTWITAALRDEQFFSLAELNLAIRDKLELFNQRPVSYTHLFDALGADTYVINNKPNGTNINNNAGSTHIEGLQKFVVEDVYKRQV